MGKEMYIIFILMVLVIILVVKVMRLNKQVNILVGDLCVVRELYENEKCKSIDLKLKLKEQTNLESTYTGSTHKHVFLR